MLYIILKLNILTLRWEAWELCPVHRTWWSAFIHWMYKGKSRERKIIKWYKRKCKSLFGNDPQNLVHFWFLKGCIISICKSIFSFYIMSQQVSDFWSVFDWMLLLYGLLLIISLATIVWGVIYNAPWMAVKETELELSAWTYFLGNHVHALSHTHTHSHFI